MTVALLALGLGTATWGAVLAAWKTLAWRASRGNKRPERWRKVDPDTVWSLLGALAGALTAGLGTSALAGAAAGMAAGLVARRVLRWGQARSERWRRLSQVAMLYECVDVYARLQYPVHSALEAASVLLPELRPVVRRCLARWGQGPLRALEELGMDLGVPEAGILVAVLQQSVQVGHERVAGVMAEEAAQLLALRDRVMEERLAMRPVYQAVYTGLPGFALVGLLLFPLGLRVIEALRTIQLS